MKKTSFKLKCHVKAGVQQMQELQQKMQWLQQEMRPTATKR